VLSHPLSRAGFTKPTKIEHVEINPQKHMARVGLKFPCDAALVAKKINGKTVDSKVLKAALPRQDSLLYFGNLDPTYTDVALSALCEVRVACCHAGSCFCSHYQVATSDPAQTWARLCVLRNIPDAHAHGLSQRT
jgi:hypothetical protein